MQDTASVPFGFYGAAPAVADALASLDYACGLLFGSWKAIYAHRR